MSDKLHNVKIKMTPSFFDKAPTTSVTCNFILGDYNEIEIKFEVLPRVGDTVIFPRGCLTSTFSGKILDSGMSAVVHRVIHKLGVGIQIEFIP